MAPRSLTAPLLALMIGPALATGCSDNNTSGGDPDMTDSKDMAMSPGDMATPPDMTVPVPTFCPASGGGMLTTAQDGMFIGTWALQSKVSVDQNLPVIGKVTASFTTLSLADMKLDGANKLQMTQKDCKITVNNGTMAAMTTVPNVVPQTTPNSVAPILVCQNGANYTWQRDPVVVQVGMQLQNPATDALPTMATDSRVKDQDGDGKPGVTIKIVTIIASGDAYTVQRQNYSYQSTALPAMGKAAGMTFDRSEQRVVDASNPSLIQNPTGTPNDGASSFKLVKLVGTYDCAKLITDEKTLFP